MDVNQVKDCLEDITGDVCKQIMMKKAEDEIKGLFKKPDDEEDKGDGGDNKALSMAGNIASGLFGGDKKEESMLGNIASGLFSGDKKEESVVDSVTGVVKGLF